MSAGNVNDCCCALPLIEGLRPACVVADRGYNTEAIARGIAERGARVAIPSYERCPAPRHVDVEDYRERNRIERLFSRLKQFRRVATRYDKLAERFASFIALAASVLWLR